jgi:hypothetical protein
MSILKLNFSIFKSKISNHFAYFSLFQLDRLAPVDVMVFFIECFCFL